MFTEKKVRDMLKDNTATYFALNVMRDYLVPNFNVLLKNGKKFKGVDLAEEMGITRQAAMVHIKKLKELNIIAEVETENKGKLWAINPDYYFLGEECPEAVLKAFERKKKF